tara:strand:- start:4203 stop:4589 length:387 start_codon:yes stop_codon:yes gene_type:complete
MTIIQTHNITSVCPDLVHLAKKEGLLFSGNIMFFVVFNEDDPIAFFGLKLSERTATMKCSYVIKSERRTGLLCRMTRYRLQWLKLNRPKIKKVDANTTKMSLNTHLKEGAKIQARYKNGITKLYYEIL